jgi:hypothetical protein
MTFSVKLPGIDITAVEYDGQNRMLAGNFPDPKIKTTFDT